MLNVMAKPMRAANKNLGVGTYYERGGHVLSKLTDWVTVKLERPLVLDERRVWLMEQEYATTSDDPVEAMSGAWKLRRDLMRQGYDSVVAVDGPDRFRIVQYRRPTGEGSVTQRGKVITLYEKQSAELASVRVSAKALSRGGKEVARSV